MTVTEIYLAGLFFSLIFIALRSADPEHKAITMLVLFWPLSLVAGLLALIADRSGVEIEVHRVHKGAPRFGWRKLTLGCQGIAVWGFGAAICIYRDSPTPAAHSSPPHADSRT